MSGPTTRSLRGRVVYRLLLAVSAVGRRIPLRTGRALGRFFGSLAYHLVRRERNKAVRHLALAFPERDSTWHRRTARAMFRHLGMSLFEIVWLPNVDAAMRDRTTVVTGIDKVMEVIDSGRGVIIFTAHCGNWEWLSFITGTYGRPVSVLQRERDEPEMNRYITEVRARAGVRTIDRGTSAAARMMIEAVRRGGILAFVLDQNIRTDSIRIPFFGHPAPTPIGPVQFAIRTEAMISIALIERRDDGLQYATFSEPMQCRKGDDPAELATRITRAYEEQIRRVPEQWVWMHDRWKERPKWDAELREREKRA